MTSLRPTLAGTTGLALLLGALASPADATLRARSASGWGQSQVNLVDSRVKATVGDQWIDVEEEAQLLVPAEWFETGDDILVEGTLTLPPHAALVGCLLWNNDTLLMGKLRGRADAQHMFDSLVPQRPVTMPQDPLLLDMQNDSTYGFKLYPFVPGGTRRFRIRYLLPLTGSNEFEIKPLLARMVLGSVPSQFTLQVRGTRTDVKLLTPEVAWPLSLPADRRMPLTSGSSIRLRLGASRFGTDGSHAIRTRVDTGAWQGDYVFYDAKVPDSILSKVNLRSETVVLWRWIRPQTFVTRYYEDGPQYLNHDGYKALRQARNLLSVGDQLTGRGDRVGMVADLGLDDSLRVFPLGDSGSRDYRNLRGFLSGIDDAFIMAHVATAAGAGGSGKQAIAGERLRFRTDLQRAGTLYSRDSGLIRHLLVVTVGPVPASEMLEMPEVSGLSGDVSVGTNDMDLSSSYAYNSATGRYEYAPRTGTALWPGVNLAELAYQRPGTGTLTSQGGVMLPKTRTVLAATLSMEAGATRLSREVVIRRGANGTWRTSFNVHAKNLGNSVRWNFWNEEADSLASFETTPSWQVATGDSVLPRLWARSESPFSPVFLGKELAPLFGFVDPLYSLLALPSDSLGRVRQTALKDSGLPFLSGREIFRSTGYGSESGNGSGDGSASGISPDASKRGFGLQFLASRRVVSIDLQGIGAVRVEIRDLQGRLVARFSDVAGRSRIEWDLRNLSGATVGKGLYVVSVQTGRGLLSERVLVH